MRAWQRTRRTPLPAVAAGAVLAVAIAFVCAPGSGAREGPPDAGTRASRGTAKAPEIYVVGHLHRYDTAGVGMERRGQRIDRMREMGFHGTRLAFEWGQIEPSPGRYDWTRHDSILGELESAGLQTYGMIGYTPGWARPDGTRPPHRPVLDGSAARGDTAFARFAAAVARRYRDRVTAWEIWNEPNIVHFWSHLRDGRDIGPDPADYFPLFRLARDSILAVDSTARVVTAGLASGPTTAPPEPSRRSEPDGYPAELYLRHLLSLGLRASRIGLHPYTPSPSRESAGEGKPPVVNPVVREAVKVLDDFDRSEARLWVTEWGVDRRRDFDPETMDAWFRSGLRGLLCHPRVAVVTVYALTDWRGPVRFGLADRAGDLTRNGEAYRRLVTRWPGCS